MVNGSRNKINWDLLRQDDANPAFSLEKSKAEYVKNCKGAKTYRRHAACICKKLAKKDKICSLGAGKGILEWHMKQINPDMYMCCTDYTKESVSRLGDLFTECDEFRVFDMLGDYSELKMFDVLIMYRVSTEFDWNTWRKIFEKMYRAGINRIIFVPAELAGIKDAAREMLLRARFVMMRKELVFAGWLYSAREFQRMFAGLYSIKDISYIGNTAVFSLEKKG